MYDVLATRPLIDVNTATLSELVTENLRLEAMSDNLYNIRDRLRICRGEQQQISEVMSALDRVHGLQLVVMDAIDNRQSVIPDSKELIKQSAKLIQDIRMKNNK